jgi:hypothetical protein
VLKNPYGQKCEITRYNTQEAYYGVMDIFHRILLCNFCGISTYIQTVTNNIPSQLSQLNFLDGFDESLILCHHSFSIRNVWYIAGNLFLLRIPVRKTLLRLYWNFTLHIRCTNCPLNDMRKRHAFCILNLSRPANNQIKVK